MVSPPHTFACAACLAVNRDQALLNPVLQAAAGVFREQFYEGLVKAQSADIHRHPHLKVVGRLVVFAIISQIFFGFYHFGFYHAP
jgi:hypothetical protein